MTFQRTLSRSPYMEFAKLRSGAKYNLATSGMANCPLADLGVSIEELDINGPTAYGYAPLNEAIAKRYRVPVECVAVANGTAMANYLGMAAAVNPGDEVLVEEPTYPLLLDTARYLGLSIKRFKRSRDDVQIDLQDLERKLSSETKLVMLCNLHNPSGVLTPQVTLREIGAMAKRVGARVLVDEVYLEMLWQKEPQSAFHLDGDTFISTNSLTKAYGLSGLRCGWVLASPQVVQRMWHINDLHGATPVHMAELLSVAAFANLDTIAKKQELLLDENRRMLKKVLESQTKLDYVWPEFGTVIAPRVKQGSAEEFCERLRREFELSVVPGRFFDMPQHVRIGVGLLAEEIRASLKKLGEALNT